MVRDEGLGTPVPDPEQPSLLPVVWRLNHPTKGSQARGEERTHTSPGAGDSLLNEHQTWPFVSHVCGG